MFHRILLAWLDDAPTSSLAVARSLAKTYDAELTVCCPAARAGGVRALLGADAAVEPLPSNQPERELLRFAHEHAFDLLVIGREPQHELLPRRVIDRASLPVLVVAEERAR
jgi:nucleotide-binding universal stress UspA family protein